MFAFDSVFGATGNDSLLPPSSQEFSFSQQNQDDLDSGATKVALRDLNAGTLSCTVAMCKNAHAAGSFKDGRCMFFGKQWENVVLVGWLKNVQESNDVWLAELDDGTGVISLRYEVKTHLDQNYLDSLEKLKLATKDDQGTASKDNEENVPPQEQQQCVIKCHLGTPAKAVGVPQVIEDDLCFMASFMRPAECQEVTATHFLEAAHTAITLQSSSKSDSATKVTMSPNETKQRSSATTTGADPYHDEKISIENSDIADAVGADRLKRVIYRFLSEIAKRGYSSDASENVVAIRSFCASRWNDHEVNAALDELDEAGVTIYVDENKSRVCLV